MKTLRTLIELSSYVPKHGPKKKLYQLAQSHSGDRAELAEHFVNRAYFRVVYKNLKDALLDGILRPKWQLSDALTLEFKIRERQLESIILIRSGKPKVGMVIAEETLATAMKYEFVDIALPICKELESLYSTVEVNTKKKYKYSRFRKQLLEAYIQECEIQSAFSDLAYCIHRRKDITHHLKEIRKHTNYLVTNNYFRFRYIYYSYCQLYYSARSDVQGIKSICQEAIKYFKHSGLQSSYQARWIFLFQLVNLYLRENSLKEAHRLINRCISLPNEGDFNWNLSQIQYCVYGFYTNQPEIVLKAWKNAQKAGLIINAPVIHSRWSSIEAYLVLLDYLGKIQYPNDFRLYRFLNQPIKQYQRVNFFFLELLHLLVTGKYDKLGDRLINSHGFRLKVLKGATHKRARIFLDLLRCLLKGQYHPIRVKHHAKKYVNALYRTNKHISVHLIDNEPIPYEKLWEWVMDYLHQGILKQEPQKVS